MTQNSLTVTGAADHVSFDSDGQTINWTTADGTAREVLVLWMGNAATTTPDPSFQVRLNRPAMFLPGIPR